MYFLNSKLLMRLLVALITIGGQVSQLYSNETNVDFNAEIRPIFNKHCISCHGGVKQAGELSFIYEQQVRDAGVIEPRDPENSELIERITSDDPEYRMPPMQEHSEGLSPPEITLLARWIAEGAAWGNHWAYVKPIAPALPEVSNASWADQDLDRFVLARLESLALEPTPAASPSEWLRRTSFDLIGLPPTLAELEAFIDVCKADPEELFTHFGKEVDRLLASPHFGERWAAIWLDLARYADSLGYESDPHRDAWPYRNWVIKALNEGMPFDEFTIKQLAGDLLPDATVHDLLATGFHRNTQTNTEGGTDDEEFRVAAVIDRVNTTWTVWHGLTFGCCQCHSHPYEPISQKEFYQFYAFFNNTADYDLDKGDPAIKLPDSDDDSSWATVFKLEKKRRRLREELNNSGRQVALSTTDWQLLKPTKVVSSQGQLKVNEEQEILAAEGTFPTGVIFYVTTAAGPLRAIKLAIRPESDDPARWPEKGMVASQVELQLITADGERQPLKIREIIADDLVGPYDPMDALKEGPEGLGAFPKLVGPRWFVLVLAEAIAPPPRSSFLLKLQHDAITAGSLSVHLRRFLLSSSNSSNWEKLLSSEARQAKWKQYEQLTSTQDQWDGIEVPVMRSRGSRSPQSTRIFVRGNWMVHGDLVMPGTPELFHNLSDEKILDEKPGRLELARWLVAKDNPLTARVLANRLWAELFGIGLVETLENFGTTGTPPSHPLLLDHLAVKLQRKGHWKIKPFLRDLVLSSTYRQANRVSAELRVRDPRNRLLARGPRTRLTAEMVRDQALVASALLSAKVGGRSVMPPQPPNVWQTIYGSREWETANGTDRYRRAIYTYWKRTSPYPSFMAFDAPSREICTARRISTNTPLQALVTLNDPAYVKCSVQLAKRAREEGGESPEDWIRWSFQTVTQKLPSANNLAELNALYEAVLAEYESSSDEDYQEVSYRETAALAVVTSTIFNLDEALTK